MEEKRLTTMAVAERFGVTREIITRLCRAGRIPYESQGEGPRRTYYIRENDIPLIEEYRKAHRRGRPAKGQGGKPRKGQSHGGDV